MGVYYGQCLATLCCLLNLSISFCPYMSYYCPKQFIHKIPQGITLGYDICLKLRPSNYETPLEELSML